MDNSVEACAESESDLTFSSEYGAGEDKDCGRVNNQCDGSSEHRVREVDSGAVVSNGTDPQSHAGVERNGLESETDVVKVFVPGDSSVGGHTGNSSNSGCTNINGVGGYTTSDNGLSDSVTCNSGISEYITNNSVSDSATHNGVTDCTTTNNDISDCTTNTDMIDCNTSNNGISECTTTNNNSSISDFSTSNNGISDSTTTNTDMIDCSSYENGISKCTTTNNNTDVIDCTTTNNNVGDCTKNNGHNGPSNHTHDSVEVINIDDDLVSTEYKSVKKGPVKCQLCRAQEAKYTCPRCEARTCSVSCVKQHKEIARCSGERDRLAFVDVSQYGERELLSDYRFLEDAERRLFSSTSSTSSHTRHAVRYAPYLNKRCKFLMKAAHKRGINLRFVSTALTKNKTNSSYFTLSTDTIDWHVDWLFPTTGSLVKDEKVAETSTLVEAVGRLTSSPEHTHLRKSLADHSGAGLEASPRFLLKIDGLPANRTRYLSLKPEQSLRENLRGTCLTEYPTIVVVPPTCAGVDTAEFRLLSKDDMPSMDPAMARHMVQHHPELNPATGVERQLLNPGSSLYTGSRMTGAN